MYVTHRSHGTRGLRVRATAAFARFQSLPDLPTSGHAYPTIDAWLAYSRASPSPHRRANPDPRTSPNDWDVQPTRKNGRTGAGTIRPAPVGLVLPLSAT